MCSLAVSAVRMYTYETNTNKVYETKKAYATKGSHTTDYSFDLRINQHYMHLEYFHCKLNYLCYQIVLSAEINAVLKIYWLL